tara:strand:- start:887 stop:1054 length:168 start_codon:yes stop_codon:yes gene_type:complete
MDQKDQYVLKNDKLTQQRKKEIKEKLSLICNRDENIDEILNSLEAYCTIILNTLK